MWSVRNGSRLSILGDLQGYPSPGQLMSGKRRIGPCTLRKGVRSHILTTTSRFDFVVRTSSIPHGLSRASWLCISKPRNRHSVPSGLSM